ncbi:DNA methyltransferase [Paraburkholderia tropica]|uniref:DNA methyltransferase n=1 Tax=Paraburkholderia tropica TaxID=92647 RepID=UPI001F30EA1F|nr:DNA methyltransferase [Paraburkholderia tropica]
MNDTLMERPIDESLLPGLEQAPVKKKRGRPAKSMPAVSEALPLTGEAPAVKTVDPRNALNDLTSTEWIPETVSVWTQRGLGANHADAQIERQHPAPFSFTDVARLVRFFTKKGHTVLDPFVGVGSTLKACAVEGRQGIGFELNPKYAELARERLRTEVRDLWAEHAQDVREGDARDLVQALPDDSLDFIVTSPPYWNILHKEDHKARQERIEKELDTRYSDDHRDLGNVADYSDFLQELASILGACARPLKAGKHMAVVVSDFREKSKYIMFHADLAAALLPYGLEMRGLKVLYQRHKRIFPYGYPYAYVPNIHHQFIMILQNAKPKKRDDNEQQARKEVAKRKRSPKIGK